MVFGKFAKALRAGGGRAASPRAAEGERIYAIGDIHGCFDLLTGLLAKIERHAASLPEPLAQHVIILGDMIDRGGDSAKILEYLYTIQQRTDRLIVLMGNHEELMLRALRGEPDVLRAWMRIGGDATVRSFGLEPPEKGGDPAAYLRKLTAAIPEKWIEWLSRLPLSAQSGDYFFCHAGIRPGVPLKRQKRSDLLWIRDEFLHDEEDHGAIVVHGHSIATEVERYTNRIGIDTGAYRSGILTALYLEGERQEILATAPEEAVAKDNVAVH